MRAQLSRAHRGEPARRVAPKTAASIRDVPLVPQLASLLTARRTRTRTRSSEDWIFPTSNGTPHGQRNLCRRGLQRAADKAGLNSGDMPRLRFHDLRHTFASHLIIDLQLDVAQVSRILGHASTTITLDVEADRASHYASSQTHGTRQSSYSGTATRLTTRMAIVPRRRSGLDGRGTTQLASTRWPSRPRCQHRLKLQPKRCKSTSLTDGVLKAPSTAIARAHGWDGASSRSGPQA